MHRGMTDGEPGNRTRWKEKLIAPKLTSDHLLAPKKVLMLKARLVGNVCL